MTRRRPADAPRRDGDDPGRDVRLDGRALAGHRGAPATLGRADVDRLIAGGRRMTGAGTPRAGLP